ncbi:unnamed protein product, partial [Candidula unifasciata]
MLGYPQDGLTCSPVCVPASVKVKNLFCGTTKRQCGFQPSIAILTHDRRLAPKSTSHCTTAALCL